MKEKLRLQTILLTALVIVGWIFALYLAPVDAFQGEVYRIIYIHVPVAFAAFFMAFVLFIHSLKVLITGKEHQSYLALSAAELGAVFTLLTLLTGMIWGKPTWGVFWTWDARLTTTFILGILFAGYLLLFHSIQDFPTRDRSCAILGIFIFADVPIIYKSVQWWRTLHQPQSIVRMGGESTIDPQMKMILLYCIFSLAILCFCIYRIRAAYILRKQEWEQKLLQSST